MKIVIPIGVLLLVIAIGLLVAILVKPSSDPLYDECVSSYVRERPYLRGMGAEGDELAKTYCREFVDRYGR